MKRTIPFVGAIVCAVGCAAPPAIAAGLSFLQKDWLLVPLEIMSIAFVIRTHPHARGLAVIGGGALLIGMYQSGVLAAILIGVGATALLGTVFQK